MKVNKIALNRKRLSVNTYGYNYSRNDFILTIFAFVAMCISMCFVHKLNVMYSTVLLAIMCLILPMLVTSFFKYKHEKTKFEEFCKYFEYMKVYFKTYKKIKLALENVHSLFDEKSMMYKCIELALKEVNETGDYQKALSLIDEVYHNSYLERFHNLLIIGEEHGSDSVYDSLELINFESWKTDILNNQKTKKSFRYMLYGMTIFSYGLSLYGVNMFSEIMNISGDGTYQMYTFFELTGIMVLSFCIYISIVNKKWVRSDD